MLAASFIGTHQCVKSERVFCLSLSELSLLHVINQNSLGHMYAEKQHSALLDDICWLICEIGLHLHITSGKETSPLFVNNATYI